ncbi:hypothetical protein J2W21_001705 [Sinomonas atrocyanea]|uniref:transmembrane-type terpene cyclase n=1 Tax=Sinomonas atrocyanea TaxID=37927 RepID=UPI002785456E|nr:hypothetical protein [Sinomonas atrocyanea]MDP9884195.1 hypothetical protein [Sinomonas atrocyanea]
MGGIGTVLTLLSGVAWTVVYAEAIRIGFTQRTYAIPAAALMLNIAWEWLYAFLDLTGTPGVQGYVNLVWAVADVAIVVTFFRFGYVEFSDRIGRGVFIVGGVGLLGVSVAVQLLFLGEFGRSNGEVYSAFLQNLLMSGLFVAMFLSRHGARGQSMVIAAAKWLGTLAPTIQLGLLQGRGFVLGIGLLCTVLDLTYIGLLLHAHRHPGTEAGRAVLSSSAEA